MQDELIHPDEALRLVLDAAPPPATEPVPLGEALGRALVRVLPSTVDHPPFDKSAMDGFAFDPALPAAVLKVVQSVAAGSEAGRRLGRGECARIMTGAPLPPGAGAVQRIEWTEPVVPKGDDAGTAGVGAEFVRFTRPETGSNVILRGENLRRGEPLLGPRLLAPQDIGILASSGYAEVEVARRPRVAVLSTGNEVVEPGRPLGGAAIYDSNGPQLAAQARSAGCVATFLGIARDEPGRLAEALGRALDGFDVVLVSGGVSMGDFDLVPRTLEALGVRRVFHKVAMKPGKPTWFGLRGTTAVFGLPGNPVSTFVNFEFLLKPHLARRMGLEPRPRMLRAVLAAPVSRRESDRVEFLPVRIERDAERGIDLARPLGYRGSSMLNILAEADGLVRVEIGVDRLEEGASVDARLIRP